MTYISPDGAFGGPTRVALGQASELSRRGHEVIVFAASPDDAPRVETREGYEIRTFPARRIHRTLGFAGMYAPGLTKSLKRELPRLDAAHIHLARDLVTLPAARAARRAGVRVVAQPHGMIDKSDNPLSRPIDAWEVKSSLASASAVLTLTEQEVRDISAIQPLSHTVPIGNGVRVANIAPYDERYGGVVFLARLHPRKNPMTFVEMAALLLDRGLEVNFVLAGPDEGEGERVAAALKSERLRGRVRWDGPIDPSRTHELLRHARVFVLPSVGEVFPMTVLEAFSAGTPTVVTSSLGIADMCHRFGAAAITDGSAKNLADAVEKILVSPAEAERLRAGAQRLMRSELNIETVVDLLEDVYEGRVNSTHSRSNGRDNA